MKLKKMAAVGAAFGIALAGVAAASPAQADPVTDGYVIVGSDTLQDAVGALANGFNNSWSSGGVPVTSFVRTSGLGKVVASWDAFAPGITGGIGTIQTKSTGPVFPRPSGSGNGKNALIASYTGNPWNVSSTALYVNAGLAGSYDIDGQIDASRSSSEGTVNGAGTYSYLPFGQDAVSYAYKAGAGVSAASISYVSSLSSTALNAIYTSASNTTVPGQSDVIVPRLPQSGSGTRDFWLKALNGGTGAITPGAASNPTATTLAENNGNVLNPGAGEIWIIPFSVASYVAQANGVAPANTTAGITLGSPDGTAPTTGAAPSLTGNNDLYTGTYGRTTYIIVPWARITAGQPGYDAGLAAALNPSSSTSLTYWGASNQGNTSKAVKLKFGFQQPVNSAYRSN
ncbi:hypothetical protein [Protaetiibacter larvae]|uniref:hypothetical protein n=1 Tax=Protaetiibacter larvae TaxID=2592654 RepID=UPI00143DFDBD|nr:hypothetical protein [Protaetiibacter larvae]